MLGIERSQAGDPSIAVRVDIEQMRHIQQSFVARHILFQVTQGAPVVRIRDKAEAVLNELKHDPEQLADYAGRYSNCPSGAQGGMLGQIQRGETVPEIERILFDESVSGLYPKLVASRFGFHIVSVDQHMPGRLLAFEDVRQNIRDALQAAAQAKALDQYVRMLARQHAITGIELNDSPGALIQ